MFDLFEETAAGGRVRATWAAWVLLVVFSLLVGLLYFLLTMPKPPGAP